MEGTLETTSKVFLNACCEAENSSEQWQASQILGWPVGHKISWNLGDEFDDYYNNSGRR